MTRPAFNVFAERLTDGDADAERETLESDVGLRDAVRAAQLELSRCDWLAVEPSDWPVHHSRGVRVCGTDLFSGHSIEVWIFWPRTTTPASVARLVRLLQRIF